MNKQNSKIVRAYLKDVSSALSCKRSLRSVFLGELRGDIEAYADCAPGITRDALYGEFGTPDEISEGFLERDDYSAFLKKAKKKVWLWRLLCVGLLILLVFFVYFSASLLDSHFGRVVVTNSFIQ